VRVGSPWIRRSPSAPTSRAGEIAARRRAPAAARARCETTGAKAIVAAPPRVAGSRDDAFSSGRVVAVHKSSFRADEAPRPARSSKIRRSRLSTLSARLTDASVSPGGEGRAASDQRESEESFFNSCRTAGRRRVEHLL
jgi:hypothetical protein